MGSPQGEPAGRIVMATVKGDVHDIGKNIVGVVLQCNNYEVIDLGVMVPAQKILDTARERNADIIGLSGLITPSLDEMCHVAAEMEREGFDLPLLIGGATTSRVHTAVKISPNYQRSQAIYVTDASRAVGVVSSLMSPEERPKAIAHVREEYARMAEIACARTGREVPHVDRRRARQPPQARLEDLPAAEAELPRHAQLPQLRSRRARPLYRLDAVLPGLGAEGRYTRAFCRTTNMARRRATLFDDAQAMLKQLIAEKWLKANAVVGFWPANSVGDDIELYTDESRSKVLATLHTLRQQMARDGDKANLALADFIAPKDSGRRRLYRRLRRHRRHRRGGRCAALRARQRRLLQDHGQGARRPSGRSLRRGAARRRCAASSGAMRPTRRSPTRS